MDTDATTAVAEMTRRNFLRRTGLGFGAAMLGSLLAEGAGTSIGPRPHFAPRARRVIYIHLIGAPSQLDLFDPKPELDKWDGRPCPEEFIAGKRFAFLRGHPNLAASRYAFQNCGRSGAPFSELLPHLGQVADELCFIRSLQTDEFNHAPAQLFLHTGFGRLGRPGFGSWVTYGLGSENRDLPSYVVLQSGPLAGAGANLWNAGFLPTVHQGIPFRAGGEPVYYLNNPADRERADQRVPRRGR
ncbi:MAG TPA: sulfatase, partial [Verrucomicrobiales bacterium]|nr:sulfatase [Verrucomicrobiales bacterium]